MEKFPDQEEPKSNELNVHVFRHGKSKYEQRFHTGIEEADDITDEAEEKLKNAAQDLAKEISPDEEVVVWASPLARTLHSAKVIAQTLTEEGISLRRKGDEEEQKYGIRVMPQLQEYDSPDRKVIMPIIEGGEVSFEGETFYIDKKETNPEGLDWRAYYVRGGLENISEEVKSAWPEKYRETIEEIEPFNELKKRALKPLSRLEKLSDKNYRVIIVTHDGLTAVISDPETEKPFRGIEKGESISLKRQDGTLQQD